MNGDKKGEENQDSPWDDAHDFTRSRVDDDVGSKSVHHVDRLCGSQLPSPRGECVRLGCERSHRAQVNHVAREFRVEHLFNVRPDLQVISAPGRAEVVHAGNLRAKSHATRAVDAPDSTPRRIKSEIKMRCRARRVQREGR